MQTHDNTKPGVFGEANNLWRTLIEALPDCAYVKDREGRFVFINPAYARILGAARPEEVIGKTDADWFPKDIADRYFAEERALLQSGQSVVSDEPMVNRATGEVCWLQTTRTPLRDDDGNIAGVMGFGRDITGQKRAEVEARRLRRELDRRANGQTADHARTPAADALAQAQRLLQALMDNIPDWIYFKDTQCRFLKCSKTHAKRLRVEPDQVVGKTDFDFHPAAIAEEFFRDEQRILQTGESLVNKVERKIKPNGEIMWTSTTKVPMRDENGTIFGIVGVNRDITDRVKAEEDLLHSRNDLEHRVQERTAELSQERLLLRTLIDNLPDAIYAKDMSCRKILVNPADLKNLRCNTEADALGKTDFDVFPRESAEKFYADDQRVIQGHSVLDREEFFFDAEGKQRWLLTSKLPMRNKEGRIVGLMGIGRDITAVKESELKLAAVHSQLLIASRQAGMAEVATGVLHNVGNVLNSVNVSAEMIANILRHSRMVGVSKLARLIRDHDGDLGAFLTEDEKGRSVPIYLEELSNRLNSERNELQEEIKKLMVNVGHIKEIVSAQQNYAGLSGIVEAIELPDLVEDALKIHSRAFLRHGVAIIKEFESLPPVSTDKHKVLQIMVNLLHNAKYACDESNSPNKEVVIRLKAGSADRVRIEVADTGVGIAQENLTRIFSHGFTTRKNGHGFGLHSGALAAKELGGSLSAHSPGVGKGAMFVLELPIGGKTPVREGSGRKPA